MNQSYLNCPSVGRSMTAEEFVSQNGLVPSWSGQQNQGNNGCCPAGGMTPSSNPCQCHNRPGEDRCQTMICCCHPVPCKHEPIQVEEGCCCKESFRAALQLLCDQELSSLLDFDAAAFITDTYAAGTTLDGRKPANRDVSAGADADTSDMRKPSWPTPPGSNGPSDNLGALTGSFRRFAPCSCDLLDIDAEIDIKGKKGCDFTASQVSLCKLDAVVIQAAKGKGECDLTEEQTTERNFRYVRRLLSERLNPCSSPCGQDSCTCTCDSKDCCCAAGLLATLAKSNLSRRVSLIAGLLVLKGVTLLGTVGNVLVLSNDKANRIYFVCVNSIQFVG